MTTDELKEYLILNLKLEVHYSKNTVDVTLGFRPEYNKDFDPFTGVCININDTSKSYPIEEF